MAASVVVGRNDHFSISLVAEWLGLRQQALNVIITLLCLSFTFIMVWQGTTWSWRMLATSLPFFSSRKARSTPSFHCLGPTWRCISRSG